MKEKLKKKIGIIVGQMLELVEQYEKHCTVTIRPGVWDREGEKWQIRSVEIELLVHVGEV